MQHTADYMQYTTHCTVALHGDIPQVRDADMSVPAPGLRGCVTALTLGQTEVTVGTLHYVFTSIVALHSFRLKLCSVKYIVHCTC